MGNRRRLEMKYAAKETRSQGEMVTLLFANEAAPTTSTPFDVVAANTPPQIASDKSIPIYAKVIYDDAPFTYGEGGRTALRKIKIEAPAQWQSNLDACYAVKLQNGWILLKKGSRINESRSLCYLDLEGYVNVSE